MATHSLTQVVSQAVWQQYASFVPVALHTVASQLQPPQPGVATAVQPALPLVAGQSAGQVALVSPLSHVPLPQVLVLLHPALA